ncbi:MAG: HAD family hydrolase [Stackebrandtia sp.]
MKRITMVCADMAGTTVSDDGIVEQAASAALEECGMPAGSSAHESAMSYVRDTMGRSKIEVFRAITSSEATAQLANSSFERNIGALASDGRITALPHAVDTLKTLRDRDVKVVLTTGFAPATQTAILEALGWDSLIDLAVTPGDGLRGRPYPDMVLSAVLRLGIEDVRQVAVAGDSTNDIYSGLRAGASVVAGVTTGAHDGNALRKAGATHVLDDIGELPAVVLGS